MRRRSSVRTRLVEAGVGAVSLGAGLAIGMVGSSFIVAFWLVTIGVVTVGDAVTAVWREQPPTVWPFEARSRRTRRHRFRP